MTGQSCTCIMWAADHRHGCQPHGLPQGGAGQVPPHGPGDRTGHTEEIKKLCPVLNIDDVVGALYDPLDGHLEPSGTTQAYAKAARIAGAEISLHNRWWSWCIGPMTGWDVVTELDTIQYQYVINAAGLWAREVGEMAGVYLPLHPMEHQYLVTDDIAEVHEQGSELPHVIDPAGETYFHQEGRGLVIGIYEQACEPWNVDGTS